MLIWIVAALGQDDGLRMNSTEDRSRLAARAFTHAVWPEKDTASDVWDAPVIVIGTVKSRDVLVIPSGLFSVDTIHVDEYLAGAGPAEIRVVSFGGTPEGSNGVIEVEGHSPRPIGSTGPRTWHSEPRNGRVDATRSRIGIPR